METYPKRNNKLIPLAFLLIHSIAILIFTRGFLLTRTELPFHSTCSDASLSPCLSNNHSNSNHNQTKCWTKPVVDRVVIIVLDALRIDFLAPSAFFPGLVNESHTKRNLSITKSTKADSVIWLEAKPWMDKLTVLQNLAFGNESSAKIFKAFADPPTTSLQRLKVHTLRVLHQNHSVSVISLALNFVGIDDGRVAYFCRCWQQFWCSCYCWG